MKQNFVKKTGLVLMTAVLFLTGCGNKQAATVSMYDLSQAMLAADSSFPDMLTKSTSDSDAEDQLTYVFDEIDYDKVDGFFISCSSEGLADEVVVIAAKDQDYVSELKSMLDEHKESRKLIYENYKPEEESRVEDAIIFTQDQYAVFIVANDSSAVKAAFQNFVSGNGSEVTTE